MIEEWKDVVGYEELFQVSNFGRFYSKRSSRILKQHRAKSGYMQVATKIKGVDKCFKLHQEVAKLFLGEPEGESLEYSHRSSYGVAEVNHIDGDKSNNHQDNLEWSSSSENQSHYHREVATEEANLSRRKKLSVMTDDEVRDIRKMYATGLSGRVVAAKFGITRCRVTSALKSYKWVI